MTHEHTAGAEADDGPEHDSALPAADTIPVADSPDELDPVVHPDEWEESPMTGPRPDPVEDWRNDDHRSV
jgi:hypothetical protein